MDTGTCSVCGNTGRYGFHLQDGFICEECVRDSGCYQLKRTFKKGTGKRKYMQLSPQKVWAERTVKEVLTYQKNQKLITDIISNVFEDQMSSLNGKLKVDWIRKTFWVEEQDGTQEFFMLQMIKGFSLDYYYEKMDRFLPLKKKRIEVVIEIEGTDAEYLRLSLEQPDLDVPKDMYEDFLIERGKSLLRDLERMTGIKPQEYSETWQED